MVGSHHTHGEIAQVFQNLVANAVKCTNTDEAITIDVKPW
jgi:signal transduction histidine kinase